LLTLYTIKPKFQALLRPLTKWLAAGGITANQVTVVAALVSVALGVVLLLNPESILLFALLPVWMFLRMALNAIDGMLAREFNQKSDLGAYLNELSDVVADAALFIPFVFVSPFNAGWVIVVIFLATLSEFAGMQGATLGASRRYDGPLGKSDRALIFGALGLWLAISGELPHWLAWLMPILALLISVTIYKRVSNGLAELNDNK